MKQYECSSRGDRRFSALYATLYKYDGHTIEYVYQVIIKGYSSIRDGKGKHGKLHTWKQQQLMYKQLWERYLAENSHLRVVLEDKLDSGYTLHDMFARGNAMNQATVLTELINERK